MLRYCSSGTERCAATATINSWQSSIILWVGMFEVLLSFTGMAVFGVRARRPGFGLIAIILEGVITGVLFYLWRQQATLRQREVMAISKMLEARNGYIREQLQLMSLRYGGDPTVLRSVNQIVQSLEIKLPSGTNKGRAAALDRTSSPHRWCLQLPLSN